MKSRSLTAGCAVIATGTLVPSQGKGQSFEIQATKVEVVGWVDDPETYPIQPKAHTMEYLREVAHLRPRTNTFGAVARVRDCIAKAIHRYFHERGFFWINTPIITASDAEGAGQMFRVSTLDMVNLPRNGKPARIDWHQDFFGKETYLTVSGQLNVEGYCLSLSKVYTFGPTFRAENSNTTRHLAEFWMIEPEIAFADLNDNATLAEDFLKYIFKAVLDERMDDMKFFAERQEKTAISRLENFIAAPFERIDYTEAVEILKKSGQKFEYPVEWGHDLQTEHERYLTEKHVGRPVVVMNYPEADQGVLHAPERRRQDRRGDGRARARHRRDHRRHRSARNAWTISTGAWRSSSSIPRTTAGIAISAATARCRTPASVSASNVSSSTPAAWPISATRFPIRACRAARSFSALRNQQHFPARRPAFQPRVRSCAFSQRKARVDMDLELAIAHPAE